MPRLVIDDPVWRFRLAYPISPGRCAIKEAGRRVEVKLRKAVPEKWDKIGECIDMVKLKENQKPNEDKNLRIKDSGQSDEKESSTTSIDKRRNITIEARDIVKSQEVLDNRTSNTPLNNGCNSDELEPLDLEVPANMLPQDAYSEVHHNFSLVILFYII